MNRLKTIVWWVINDDYCRMAKILQRMEMQVLENKSLLLIDVRYNILDNFLAFL